jgi:integrase
LGKHTLKLPSHLAISRHGIFYFRLTVRCGSTIREKRWSLKTRDPAQAKIKALGISAAIKAKQMNSAHNPKKFVFDDLSTWPTDEKLQKAAAQNDELAQLLLDIKRKRRSNSSSNLNPYGPDFAENVRSLQIKIGGLTLIADPNDPADLTAAREMAQALMQPAYEPDKVDHTSIISAGPVPLASGSEDALSTPSAPVSGSQRNLAGLTLDELITRYATRKRDANEPKTNYEYEKMQRKFEKWVHTKKKIKPYPVRLITRSDISDFIDDLMADGVSPQTIQKKYLSALNGIFSLAQTTGAIPAGELPTKNHKLFTKADKKKAQHKSGYKPFTDEELSQIFDPANLLALEKPCDFWLPLLGLFTGGRISELCQLKVSDIKQIDGIWSMDINDEDAAQTLKTPAAMRKIPLPPQLIQIGFLDYLELVRPYGDTIFPYVQPDKFNHYGKTPGRRFGEYLDRLKITSPNKVFHSFRSTSNNRLKQLGVGEETRCQFIGHEHDTVNSKVYSTAHAVKYLFENVSKKLDYPHLKLETLRFPKDKQAERLTREMAKATRFRNIKAVRAARAERNGTDK